ncbi:MAG: four helix bundle protein [Gemmatimonadetes bacterium]|nr:four helix bundle protein [Gemmatimonadota bacterium]
MLETHRSLGRTQDRAYPGLSSQMRRAAAAIPTNIAEGCGQPTRREFARFLQIALASAHELDYHLLLAHDLGALAGPHYARLDARTAQVKQMLSALLRRVREKPALEGANGEAARRAG